jgi:UDP-N-acetylmuramyl-tripeptide synthetase
MKMKLSRLVENLLPGAKTPKVHGPGGDPFVTSIHYRAQEVAEGGLFVAIKGLSADGHDYIEEAVGRGAAAVVAQKPRAISGNTKLVLAENSRRALARIAARFYGHPSRNLFVIGITGTNGKTTTSFLVEKMLQTAGHSVGVIGTIDYRFGGRSHANPVTTPESLDLQRILAEMHSAGTTHVVMEVSSHALDLERVHACRIDVGVFTNLSQDHLDYHGDIEAYWQCKRLLFDRYLTKAHSGAAYQAVINCEDQRGKILFESQRTRLAALATGLGPPADIFARVQRQDNLGIAGTIETPVGSFPFASSLTGRHNLENILNAAGVGVAVKLPLETIARGIAALDRVPGRLESVPNEKNRFVYVDYAHTPDALENVLKALRPLTRGRLICVFGCGGDRDEKKRPMMGAIAAKLCDVAVITSDNPRSEDPAGIIDQILPGARKHMRVIPDIKQMQNGNAGRGFTVVVDRRKAIGRAIGFSKPQDTVLIAGKGHETYQIVGEKTIAFDDREEARKALSKLNGD